MAMEFKSGRKSNIFIIAGMEISIWTINTCLFSFFPLHDLMYYSSYGRRRDWEVLSSFPRSNINTSNTMSNILFCISCERYESLLECIRRTKGRSSADGDDEDVNSLASEWSSYFISALSWFTLEIPPENLNIATPHTRRWGQVLPATSAARTKGESEWEKDTELEKTSRVLVGYVG